MRISACWAIVVSLAFVGMASGSDRPSAAGGRASVSARPTTVMGTVWTETNAPIPDAKLRLRNVVTGRIEATAIANAAGQFAFQNIEGGTYVVELVTESGKILTIGHIFTIAPGETVATFVRLGTRVPWYTSFFSNAAAAAATTAAAQGVTAIVPTSPPVSRNR